MSSSWGFGALTVTFTAHSWPRSFTMTVSISFGIQRAWHSTGRQESPVATGPSSADRQELESDERILLLVTFSPSWLCHRRHINVAVEVPILQPVPPIAGEKWRLQIKTCSTDVKVRVKCLKVYGLMGFLIFKPSDD